jgi:3-deoxy-D-manno-octulosonate 8-phosphate phosphatase (KDO 8-P phosphatase)
MATLAERCNRVELLVLDVDGVLTDGGIIYTDNGVELKQFHVRDGSGLAIWRRVGKRAAITTGRTSSIVEHRAAELGITPVIQGSHDKLTAFRHVLTETGFQAEQVCYVGDDLPDLPVLLKCGLAVAVADACAEVRAAAHHVTKLPGGRGAVRETIELILQAQGHWQRIIERYSAENSR